MIKIISDVGFCFGVKNAVEKLKEIKNDGGRIFLLHPLIHNALLNDKLLKENNATIFAGEDLKKEDTILFSAHGHLLEEEKKYSTSRQVDATCPLIKERYKQLKKCYSDDVKFIFVGKKNHQETKAFLSHFPYLIYIDVSSFKEDIKRLDLKKQDKTFLIPQTTISSFTFDEIKRIIDEKSTLTSFISPCKLYDSRAREAIDFLKDKNIDKLFFIVVGDKSSSNANEILNQVKKIYPSIEAKIVLSATQLDIEKLKNRDIFISSATSASLKQVEDLVDELKSILQD